MGEKRQRREELSRARRAASPGRSDDLGLDAAHEGLSKRFRAGRNRPQAVVIGCSTGGPAGLTSLLESLVVPLEVPIFVVQHMPPRFTKNFADHLNSRVDTRVVEAEYGMSVEGGTCYIAPGGLHLELRRRADGEVMVATVDSEPVGFCKPSVERLFATAANVFGHRLLAVMLTGMGRDGSDSAAKLAAMGCPVLVQDEESSAVWGMPGAVVADGTDCEVLHLDQIGARIVRIVSAG